jgi:hypothetical protein
MQPTFAADVAIQVCMDAMFDEVRIGSTNTTRRQRKCGGRLGRLRNVQLEHYGPAGPASSSTVTATERRITTGGGPA